MIQRYSLPEMAALWSDDAKYRTWLQVEVLAVQAWAEIGVIPIEHAAAVRDRANYDTASIHEREKLTEHDLAAFVDVVAERVGRPAGAWVHYGLTSSDVLDTSLSLTLTRSATLLVDAARELECMISSRARELRDMSMVGRTHGIHAQPTTMGAKLALWALQVRRDRERLEKARYTMAVGKLSGAVGTYSNVDPRIEAFVCDRLGLRAVPASQILARDRHAEYVYACASIGATIEAFATEIRHLQRTEVGEAAEPFHNGARKGFSAMPHKRNPVRVEQLSGLARVLRGNLGAALENVAVWHERDISHSSVERVILPDSSLLAYYLIRQFTDVVLGLEVFPERMLENLERSHGLVFSEAVLLALVECGLDRDAAYRITQEAAMEAWEARRPFREVLLDGDYVTAYLTEDQLDTCFDLGRALRNVEHVFDVLEVELDEKIYL